MKKQKIIKDKLGYVHTPASIELTQIVLSDVKDGDVVNFSRKTVNGCSSWASIIMNNKQWNKNNSRRTDDKKSLLDYVNEGYDLEIIGHWRDGIKPYAFWNDVVAFDYDLIDLMELNKTI